jgi:L-alanine-DL-glutamate epimerase-like enolase superfamily enzyme
MRITAVRLLQLRGAMRTQGPFWEDRLVRPIDIYPEYRKRNDFEGGTQADPTTFHLEQYFLHIETDEGPSGIAGPLPEMVAIFVAKRLRPIILNQDPIAHEKLWDQMHRIMVHGRQGDAMLAISAIDCALWDLKGRWLNQPVFRLLGGPTRDAVPAYASMLGFDVTDMGRVRERAAEYQNIGYAAQKWFFRHGPMSGPDGLHRNIALVRTLRETLGEDYDIMLDCWQSFDPIYAIELAERIAEYRPRWLEEAVMPDRIDSYVRVKERTNIPLSGAEHEYTRWGFKRFIDAGALDILQPDIYWAGGLSEVLKIAAYASAHDLIVIPHGHSSPAGIHFSLAQSPILTPYQEFLVKWNAINQHFLAHPVTPRNGMIPTPEQPGLGMDLDPAKIEQQSEVFA